MDSNTFRIGILGAGDVAETAHVPVLSQMRDVQVAWVCDQDEPRARRLARAWRVGKAFDRLEACPDVDAILVAIPVGRRREVLATAFRRGWHALVEKPFAASVDDHLRFLADAGRAGVEVGVGLTRRFFRSTRVARAVLDAGIAGPIQEVWASEAFRLGTTGREGPWYQADPAAAGGGVLMETGAHVVDQVFNILGIEAFQDLRAGFHKVDGIDIEARITAGIARPGADPVPLRLLISRMRDCQSGIIVRCEHATVRIGLGADGAVDLLDPGDRPVCRLEGPSGASNLYQAFEHEWRAFQGQCRSRVASLVDAASALLSTRFIEAAYRSAGARA